jgi:RNA-directed DNA polymerase
MQKISKMQVWEAFKHVKARGGSAGIDGVTIDMVDAEPRRYLYPVWSRMASGSYHPKPVKEVLIPKHDGTKRPLGIPTVCDRVAQMVVKQELEDEVESQFSENSFGYRPRRGALNAVGQCRTNCMRYNWVIDLDIKGFFDNIDHRLVMRAVKRFTKKKHILLYVKRWLKAPIKKADGSIEAKQGKGTPQGGVISPLLANIFLHLAFDVWFEEKYPEMKYERYADDIIVHCKTYDTAQEVLETIKRRLGICKLEVHPEKTRIIYCKRNSKFHPMRVVEHVSFTFLGYEFKPRWVRYWHGKYMLKFTPAISRKAKQHIVGELRKMKLHGWVTATIEEIAEELSPKLRGWINYYGKFRPSAMREIFLLLNFRLLKWVQKKYKKFRRRKSELAWMWLRGVYRSKPGLFPHWEFGVHP